MFIEHHPEIDSLDFCEMYAAYKDYLRSKNFNDLAIKSELSFFDLWRVKQQYEKIYALMRSIGVRIIYA